MEINWRDLAMAALPCLLPANTIERTPALILPDRGCGNWERTRIEELELALEGVPTVHSFLHDILTRSSATASTVMLTPSATPPRRTTSSSRRAAPSPPRCVPSYPSTPVMAVRDRCGMRWVEKKESKRPRTLAGPLTHGLQRLRRVEVAEKDDTV